MCRFSIAWYIFVCLVVLYHFYVHKHSDCCFRLNVLHFFTLYLAMVQFTIAQRLIIVKTFYRNGESYAATVSRLRATLGPNEAPNESTVRRLMRKFNETGSTVNIKSPGRHRSGQSEQNVAMVRDSVAVSAMKFVLLRSQELGIGCSSVRRILRYDLICHAYKIQFNQQLKAADHEKWRNFVNFVLRRRQEDDGFARKII